MSNTETFLIDNLLSGLVNILIEQKGLTLQEALDVIYNSKLYDKIMDTETGLYFQSEDYNFEILSEEL